MARYDRIAALPLPPRDRAYPGWLSLADLSGRERDADLGRRARLRLMAARPLHRLLERGFERVPPESYERQIDGVREELGHLPVRDAERGQLAEFLNRIRDRRPPAVVAAALDLGAALEGDGFRHAAEEYYRSALELARAARLGAERVRALRLLGRVLRHAGRLDESEVIHRRAVSVADELAEREQWGRAAAGLAAVLRDRGQSVEAVELLRAVLARGEEWGDAAVIGAAAAELCAAELATGDVERALEHGWTALQRADLPAEREELLARLGDAFARLGLFAAADRCFQLLTEHARQQEARVTAAAERAALAAAAGARDLFRARRKRLLPLLARDRDGPVLAGVHLRLARGALHAGDTDFARDHLREAVQAAERHGAAEVLRAAEELLPALERAAEDAAAEPTAPGEVARRIAAEVELMETPAAASP